MQYQEGDLIYKISYFPYDKRYEVEEVSDVHVLKICESGKLCREVQVSEDVNYLEYFVYVNICPDFSESEDDIYSSALSQGSFLIRKSIEKYESDFYASQRGSDCEEDIDESITKIDWDELTEKALKYKKILEDIADLTKIIDSYKKLYEPVCPPWNPSPIPPYEPPPQPFDPFYPHFPGVPYPYTIETTTELRMKTKNTDVNDDE